MGGRIRRCPHDRTYTLGDVCPVCGRATRTAHPARFSPVDRFSRHRREVRSWTR
ncbi:MAG: RNA-protein complex protein Nop10 [Methanomicrobiales archaeon]